MGLEFAEQRIFFVGREPVASRVGNHGDATCIGDPLHRVLQAGPAVRHVAWFAFGEVFAEHFRRVAADTRVHQVPRKVGPRNQFGVAHITQSALVGIQDADLGQTIRHFLCAFAAATAGAAQTFGQRGVVSIEAQAHDVHGLVGKGDRNFCPCQEGQALSPGCCQGASQTRYLVVVGQCPKLHTVGFGAFSQSFGGEGAVRHDGVAVQVGVDHVNILGPCRSGTAACGGMILQLQASENSPAALRADRLGR